MNFWNLQSVNNLFKNKQNSKGRYSNAVSTEYCNTVLASIKWYCGKCHYTCIVLATKCHVSHFWKTTKHLEYVFIGVPCAGETLGDFLFREELPEFLLLELEEDCLVKEALFCSPKFPKALAALSWGRNAGGIPPPIAAMS